MSFSYSVFVEEKIEIVMRVQEGAVRVWQNVSLLQLANEAAHGNVVFENEKEIHYMALHSSAIHTTRHLPTTNSK